ncbi:hypothetical protein F2Q70_00045646 [Brassica cretica]|uniref:Methyltransferase n=1 Tax=Brassica cretica TaxID=69181 RepID=A0A8S9KBJ1_BRACR|nr:hypothetical protein F2Q70_00045646 [Brassica cretica]
MFLSFGHNIDGSGEKRKVRHQQGREEQYRCEAFPSYPRTYDLVHADNLLSLQTSQHRSSCSLLNIFTEIDRLLRPEGWVIIRDTAQLVETARALTAQLKWEARVVEVESSSEQRLLICQKPFTKRQSI